MDIAKEKRPVLLIYIMCNKLMRDVRESRCYEGESLSEIASAPHERCWLKGCVKYIR